MKSPKAQFVQVEDPAVENDPVPQFRQLVESAEPDEAE